MPANGRLLLLSLFDTAVAAAGPARCLVPQLPSPRGGTLVIGAGKAAASNAPAYLMNNDGYSFSAALDDLLVTGPTMTNVNHFRALLIR